MVRAYRICQKYWGVLWIKSEEFSSYMDELRTYANDANSEAILEKWCKVSKIPISPKKVRIIYWMSRLN